MTPRGGVVLVHGLWHVPAHFDLVSARLRAMGVDVVVPELHRGSLAADTAAVQGAVDASARDWNTTPLVLGHSYGGSVITGLTGAAHLVYLAAFVPDRGESAASLGGPAPWADAAVVRRPDGSSEVDARRAVDVLYADCPPDVALWASRMLRPQAAGHGRGAPERTAWRGTPSTYVVCTEDRVLDPDLQRRMAVRCTQRREWASGHSPFLSRPEALVGLLTRILGRVGPSTTYS